MARQMARPRPTPGRADSFSPRVNLSNEPIFQALGQARAVVGHAHLEMIALHPGGQADPATGRRELGGVVQQVAQDTLDQHGVEGHLGQVGG
jgi:hypothetical protein